MHIHYRNYIFVKCLDTNIVGCKYSLELFRIFMLLINILGSVVFNEYIISNTKLQYFFLAKVKILKYPYMYVCIYSYEFTEFFIKSITIHKIVKLVTTIMI